MKRKVSEKNQPFCFMCGATKNDPDPYKPGRKIRLFFDRIGTCEVVSDNHSRTVCNNCDEGRRNLPRSPAPNMRKILRSLQTLSTSEQRVVFGRLRNRLVN